MKSFKPHVCRTSKGRIFVFTITTIFIVVILFWLILCLSEEEDPGIVQGNFDKRQENNPYTYIHPLLDSASNFDNDQNIFEEELNKSLFTLIKTTPEIVTSVYFSELTDHNQISINSDQKYNLASLIKVPLMMGYYKLEENEPGFLSTQATYNGADLNLIKNIKDDSFIKLGTPHSLEAFIDSMIVNSDNNAATLLHELKNQAIRTTFQDLNVDLPKEDMDISKSDYITSEQFSIFLKILYNSTYLNRTNSEKALELLARTSYTGGLVAGVTSETRVAHKFGERRVENNKVLEYQEFHDCGVVYKIDTPYILCIMTRGKDLDKQQELVQNISKTVFDMVSK